MILKTAYTDEDGNEMECYPNSNGKICLKIAKNADVGNSNYIALDKENIKYLTEILSFYQNVIKD